MYFSDSSVRMYQLMGDVCKIDMPDLTEPFRADKRTAKVSGLFPSHLNVCQHTNGNYTTTPNQEQSLEWTSLGSVSGGDTLNIGYISK